MNKLFLSFFTVAYTINTVSVAKQTLDKINDLFELNFINLKDQLKRNSVLQVQNDSVYTLPNTAAPHENNNYCSEMHASLKNNLYFSESILSFQLKERNLSYEINCLSNLCKQIEYDVRNEPALSILCRDLVGRILNIHSTESSALCLQFNKSMALMKESVGRISVFFSVFNKYCQYEAAHNTIPNDLKQKNFVNNVYKPAYDNIIFDKDWFLYEITQTTKDLKKYIKRLNVEINNDSIKFAKDFKETVSTTEMIYNCLVFVQLLSSFDTIVHKLFSFVRNGYFDNTKIDIVADKKKITSLFSALNHANICLILLHNNINAFTTDPTEA